MHWARSLAGSLGASVDDTADGCLQVENRSEETESHIVANEEFMVFPNPSQGNFEITIPLESEGGRIEIYDTRGKILWQQHYKNEKTIRFNDQLVSGIYLIQFYPDNNVRSSKKLIILN